MAGITPVGATTAPAYPGWGFRLLTLSVLLLTVIGIRTSFSQQAAPNSLSAPSTEVLQSLKDSLFDLNQEIQLLQHFLEASTVDTRSLLGANLRSWRINNPALRDSLFSAFIQVDSSVQGEAGAEAAVLATLDNDLIEVRFGNAVFKGIALKEAIDRSGDRNLYRKVASSYTYSRDIELRDPEVRLGTAFSPQIMESGSLPHTFSPGPMEVDTTARRMAAELSLTELSVQAGEHWGGAIRLGLDEANLPFWTSGTFQLVASYNRIKFGAALPLRGGRYGFPLFAPFTIRPRLLNGAPGVVASADFGVVGGSLAFLRMTSDHLSGLTDPARFHYLSGYAIVYSSFGITLSRSSSARAKFGVGMRRIVEGRLTPPTPAGPEGFIEQGHQTAYSPYISFEYVRREPDERVRAGVQFFDLSISFFGSLDIIPGVLSLEARYLWPVAPSLRAWENPDFLVVTPKLRLVL